MQKGPDSEFRSYWQTSPLLTQQVIIKAAGLDTRGTIPLMLSVSGPEGYPETVFKTIYTELDTPLLVGDDPNIPIYRFQQGNGETSGAPFVAVGLVHVSRYFTSPPDFELLGFYRNPGTHPEHYQPTIDIIVQRSNRLLTLQGYDPVPRPPLIVIPNLN